MFNDFKYSFLFLGKFLSVYFCANILYGIFINSYAGQPDPLTYWVTKQTSQVQSMFGVESSIQINKGIKSISMQNNGDGVINVFEGCNGINVMIVFVAFLVAYGGSSKRMLWFLPLGLFIIHLFNLIRIMFLYAAAQQNTRYFYYIHKYFFTAALYLVVIVLWIVWVAKLSNTKTKQIE
jgi:exosortase family protein XrtF